jgi:hypothetical protein
MCVHCAEGWMNSQRLVAMGAGVAQATSADMI